MSRRLTRRYGPTTAISGRSISAPLNSKLRCRNGAKSTTNLPLKTGRSCEQRPFTPVGRRSRRGKSRASTREAPGHSDCLAEIGRQAVRSWLLPRREPDILEADAQLRRTGRDSGSRCRRLPLMHTVSSRHFALTATAICKRLRRRTTPGVRCSADRRENSMLIQSAKGAAAATLFAAALALAGLVPAQAQAPSVTKQCGDKWAAAKAAGTTGDLTWPKFLSQCRTEMAAQPASATTAAPAPAPANPAARSDIDGGACRQCGFSNRRVEQIFERNRRERHAGTPASTNTMPTRPPTAMAASNGSRRAAAIGANAPSA